jgi:hypothetical protein
MSALLESEMSAASAALVAGRPAIHDEPAGEPQDRPDPLKVNGKILALAHGTRY